MCRARRALVRDPDPHVGTGRALDQRDRGVGRQPFELVAVHCDDDLTGLQARARRGRGVEYPPDQQTAPLRPDRYADAREAGWRVELAKFARREVVGETVAEALDDS